MNIARLVPFAASLLLATSLAAQDPGADTARSVRFPSPWHLGLEVGGGLTHEDLEPPEKGATVGGAYVCLGVADVPGTEIRMTGCLLGGERVHDVHGADFSAIFTEPRFALVGGRPSSRPSWEGGLLVQIGYGFRHASTDTLPGGNITNTGLFWSPGVFVSRLIPAPGGLPRWALTGRIGGVTLVSIGATRYF